ncbi:alpha/beta-hydrolase [Xylariomycetidae sp. FL0641]|nr:alpha/beta-hydrolase [Xylariomycetidae sp. FL0641]
MLPLSPDSTFHFELLRVLAHADYGAADVGEVLVAAGEIAPGDFESWHAAFSQRAQRILSRIDPASAPADLSPVSVRDALFRAATYCRAADFFLHGNADDPRIEALWKTQAQCFDAAMARLEVPGERMLLRSREGGFDVPVLWFPATGVEEGEKRAVVVLGNGFDGSMEEIWHLHGAAARERGYHVVCYEGPGQPTVRRAPQELGFMPEWQHVVAPVLDFLDTVPTVDSKRVALLGYSMGSVLAGRAAAAPGLAHRVAALFQIDGLYSFGESPVVSSAMARFADVADFGSMLTDMTVPTGMRWCLGHGMWAFKAQTPAELVEMAQPLTLRGLEDNIKCPVFVGLPAEDQFFSGQPEKVKEALGERATLFSFTDEDAAGTHCHVGAQRYVNEVMWGWFEKMVPRQ